MNPFDSSILHFINQFARQSENFDSFVQFVADQPLLKGGILASLLWAGWFYRGSGKATRREAVIATIGATVLTLVLVKVLRHFLPFRLRPLHDPDIGFRTPYHVSTDALWNWSSFPSDTAAMVFALATGLFFIDKRLGSGALLWSLVVVCIPRIFLGFHYPSDVVAGALIGALGAVIMTSPQIRRPVAYYPLLWSRRWPGLFYAAFFYVTAEIGAVFENTRNTITFFLHAFVKHV